MSRPPVRSLWRRAASVVAAAAIATVARSFLCTLRRGTRHHRCAPPTPPNRPLCWCTAPGLTVRAGHPSPRYCRTRATTCWSRRTRCGACRRRRLLAAYLQQATTGPIVLVGHSYGGAVITNAALADPDVQALVYVDAFAPAEGETVGQIIGASTSALNVPDPTTVFNFVAYPGAVGGDVDVYLKQDTFDNYFAQDVPPAVRAVLSAGQKPSAFLTNLEPSGPPAWASLPSWYVLGTEDLVIPPDTQREQAERAGSTSPKSGRATFR